MRYRIAIAALCGSVFSSGAYAENPFTYDVETTLSYARIGGTITVYELDVERYLESVSTQYRPYAEAGFLQHASNIGVAIYNIGVDRGDGAGSELGFNAGIHYVLDGGPLVISAKIGGAGRELNKFDENLNTAIFGVGAGAYVTQGAYLGAGLTQTDRTFSSAAYRTRENTSYTSADVNMKVVFEIADDRALAVTASGTRSKFDADSISDSNALDLGLAMYIDQETSIGIETMDEHRVDGSDLRVRNAALRWFIVPEMSVKFEFGQLMDSDPAFGKTQKHQVYTLRLSARM